MALFIHNVSRLWNGNPTSTTSPSHLAPPSPHILSSSPPDFSLELYVLDFNLIVCTIAKDAIAQLMHPIVKIALLPQSRPKFFSFTETNADYTVVTTEDTFEDLMEHQGLEKSEHPWRALTVSAGALGASDLVGVSKIAKSVISPLADHEISVLCMSTYQSDYILIQEPDYEDAINCLSRHFKIFNENHEKIGDCKKSATSCKSAQGTMRPVVHPFVSPSKRYHITGLDASRLPIVSSLLLELMFFPELQSKDKDTPDTALERNECFFHFSVVNGDISFVLSTAALQRFPENTLYTSMNEDSWRMIRIGDSPLGFDIHGVVAQISEPLADARISTYYISTFKFGHALVPESHINNVLELLEQRRQGRSSREGR